VKLKGKRQMEHTLYVGDLLPEVTEATLYSIFSAVGSVSSVRICRDYLTGHSMGYAYVNFHLQADAERALEALNYTKIRGRPCRVSWSNQDAKGAGRPQRRSRGFGIVVSNLSKTIDKRRLVDTFRMFGDIISCKMMCDTTAGENWSQGIIHFASGVSADNAIDRANGMVVEGQALHVTRYRSPRERDGYSKENFVSLYVKNFPDEWDESKLKELAAKYGEYKDCVIQRDDAGKSRGFGFINFKNPEDAKKAVDGLNELEVTCKSGDKLKLYVARAQSKRERQKLLKEKYDAQREDEANRNLYVKGLLDSVDQEQLRAVFSSVGAISSCRVMREKNGISKGFGFVLYETEEAAREAIQTFHSRELHGIGGPLHVAIAKKSKPRHQRFNNQIYTENSGPYNNYGAKMAPWIPYENHASSPVGNMPFGNHPAGYSFPPPNPIRPYSGGYVGIVPQMRRMSMPPPFYQYQQIPYHHVTPNPSYLEDRELARIMQLAPKEQKQMLGEKIFSAIERKREKVPEAGKITGMLLEMDSKALIKLLHEPALLDEKIQQATEVLRKYRESSEKAVE